MIAFEQTMGAVGALCIGVMGLTLFFNLVGYISGRVRGTSGKILVAQDFIKKDALVTVKITGGDAIERVKFIGFTKAAHAGKDSIPYPYARMAVFESEAGERVYVPATTIQFIKELPAASAT